jgi:hypothetical protein
MAERFLHRRAELQRIEAEAAPLTANALLTRLKQEWEARKPRPGHVPELLSARYLHEQYSLLEQHCERIAKAAADASNAAPELTVSFAGGPLPSVPDRATFSLAIAGAGEVCDAFNFMIVAAGVRLADGSVTRATDVRGARGDFLRKTQRDARNRVQPSLPVPLHVCAHESKFVVRRAASLG